MLPSPLRSGLGLQVTHFRGHHAFTVVTARRLASILQMGCQWASGQSVSLLPAIQATGLSIITPAGLTPAGHTRLCWTHYGECSSLGSNRSVLPAVCPWTWSTIR